MDTLDALGNGGVKRIFRARRKINMPGILSHITQRASGAERLFHEEDDYLEMLARLKKVSQSYELEFIAFVLMPNHVHLLLHQNKANLDEAMRELFSRYARRHNMKYERKGHLFGGRYRQAVCLDDAYVLTVSLYIHLNPVRTGLALEPADYRWSSCRLFTEYSEKESFVSPEKILKLLSENHVEAVDIYRKILMEGQNLNMGEIMEDRLVIDDLRSKLSTLLHSIGTLPTFRKDKIPKDWNETEIEERIAEFVEGRIRPLPKEKTARKYLVEQLISRGFTRSEIARKLGVSRRTIYNVLVQPMK